MGRRFLTASGCLPLTLWMLTMQSDYFNYQKSALGGWTCFSLSGANYALAEVALFYEAVAEGVEEVAELFDLALEFGAFVGVADA